MNRSNSHAASQGHSIMKLLRGLVTKPPEESSKWQKLMTPEFIPIDDYYEIWRECVRRASRTSSVISNGWAFSTRSCISVYENFVATDEIFGRLYRDRSESVPGVVNLIKAQLKGRQLGGLMIYGYGNLIRESQLVEVLQSEKVCKAGPRRVYLIDCSVLYHLFAESKFNPLLRFMKRQCIQPELIDFVSEDELVNNSVQYWRNDLNPMMPTLHVFFGNTFCNLEKTDLARILSKWCRIGDFIVSEHATYAEGFANNPRPDYVSEMAKAAVADLFRVNSSLISASNIKYGPDGMCVEVSYQSSGESLEFKSMLRRRYLKTELTNDDYRFIGEKIVIPNVVVMDVYQRLKEP